MSKQKFSTFCICSRVWILKPTVTDLDLQPCMYTLAYRLAPLTPMPKSSITTSLNQFVWLKRVLVSLCQRPDSGPVRHLRAVIIPYKLEKRWSHPPQTNTLWAKPLIRTPGPEITKILPIWKAWESFSWERVVPRCFSACGHRGAGDL